MNELVFCLGLAVLVATALFAVASLRLPSLLQQLLGAYLLACSEVILLGEALSLLHAVSRSGYLAGQTVLLAAAVVLWDRQGRPRLVRPRLSWPVARAHPIVVALGIVVGAAVLYQAFLVLATPPNNWDSLTYHLSRVAYWLQHGGVAYVPDAHTARQNAFPPNSELEILYTFAFLRGDGAAALPQLAAEGALLLAVAGLARRLGFSRPAAVYAALLTATLTQVALQSTTTQNDLTVAALVAACAYFLLGSSLREWGLAGIAFALAVGTKPTFLLAIPALIAFAGLTLPGGRALLRAAVIAAVALALLGSYGYVLNLVRTGEVLGPPAASRNLRPRGPTLDGTASTAARVVYRFIDLSGFSRASEFTGPVERAGEAVFDVAGIPVNPPETTGSPFLFRVNVFSDPDLSFFGPLGILLVLPLAFAFPWSGSRSVVAPACALAVPLAIVALALTYRYNEFVGRFLLVPVSLAMPLAASLYRSRVVASAAAALGALTLVVAHAYDRAKPTGLGATTPVWRLSRSEVQGITRHGMAEVLATIEKRIPPRERIGVILGNDDWDYPLYGRTLGRRLIPLHRVGALREAEREGLRWVVVGATRGPAYLPGWRVRFFPDSQWTLISRA